MECNTYQIGLQAEHLVSSYLEQNGYQIIATRWKSAFGEIDIIARTDNDLIFIEVKARNRLRYNEQMVTKKQQKRSAKAALKFLSDHEKYARNANIRFDYVLVEQHKITNHFKNAWYIETE